MNTIKCSTRLWFYDNCFTNLGLFSAVILPVWFYHAELTLVCCSSQINPFYNFLLSVVVNHPPVQMYCWELYSIIRCNNLMFILLLITCIFFKINQFQIITINSILIYFLYVCHKCIYYSIYFITHIITLSQKTCMTLSLLNCKH